MYFPLCIKIAICTAQESESLLLFKSMITIKEKPESLWVGFFILWYDPKDFYNMRTANKIFAINVSNGLRVTFFRACMQSSFFSFNLSWFSFDLSHFYFWMPLKLSKFSSCYTEQHMVTGCVSACESFSLLWQESKLSNLLEHLLEVSCIWTCTGMKFGIEQKLLLTNLHSKSKHC